MAHTLPSTTPPLASTLNELLAYHDQQFVLCAFQTLLGRDPDPEDLGYYLDQLRTECSKMRIVAQLFLSEEGKAYKTNLSELDKAIRRHQREQYLLIGWLFRRLHGEESKHLTERNLRAEEHQLFLSRQDIQGEAGLKYVDLLAPFAGELLYWKSLVVSQQAFLEKLMTLNENDHQVFCFHIDKGKVSLISRSTTNHFDEALTDRVILYLNFLKNIVTKFLPDLTTIIPLYLGDCAPEIDIPMFSFQKNHKTRLLLLPDIEFLVWHFYEEMEFQDNTDFSIKTPKVIFVGSTTGVDPHTGIFFLNTRENIDLSPSERIRAAKYFSVSENVIFKLPSITQCDNEDTINYLRSFSFCNSEAMSWKQQYEYRYIISLDGNGATCSRVVLALKSHSVLLKYASEHILYYFHWLIPWKHYIPISRDQDVEAILSQEKEYLDFYRSIADNANDFCLKYLKKIDVYRYAATVINEFHGLFNKDDSFLMSRERIDSLHCLIDIETHVQEAGDLWNWPEYVGGMPDSDLAIEGFTISSASDMLLNENIEYDCMIEGEEPRSWTSGGYFTGTKGLGKPVVGFRMRLLREAFGQFYLMYRVVFQGGKKSPWMSREEWCFEENRLPVVSFEVKFIERH